MPLRWNYRQAFWKISLVAAKKKSNLLQDIFEGRYTRQRMATLEGRGGREVRNNGHDGLGGILILEFICIKFMTMVLIFKEDQEDFDSNYF